MVIINVHKERKIFLCNSNEWRGYASFFLCLDVLKFLFIDYIGQFLKEFFAKMASLFHFGVLSKS